MEYRRLGASGFKVPVLTFGTVTFNGSNGVFKPFGTTDVTEARLLVDICMDAGVTMFDTSDVYGEGASEEILGQAIRGKRSRVIVSTKVGMAVGDVGPNDLGS